MVRLFMCKQVGERERVFVPYLIGQPCFGQLMDLTWDHARGVRSIFGAGL